MMVADGLGSTMHFAGSGTAMADGDDDYTSVDDGGGVFTAIETPRVFLGGIVTRKFSAE